ncbi:Uncharacterised protein [Vibrio cholerae]|nr:Uncharacterised protein [Vibrio cholerae]
MLFLAPRNLLPRLPSLVPVFKFRYARHLVFLRCPAYAR